MNGGTRLWPSGTPILCVCHSLPPACCVPHLKHATHQIHTKQDPALSQGKITNLMSIDAQSFVEATPLMQELWSSPIEILFIVGFLFHLIGPSCLAGVAVILRMLRYLLLFISFLIV